MDSLSMPSVHNVHSQVIAMKYGLMSYFHTDMNTLEVTRVESCLSRGEEEKCTLMWEMGRRQLQEDSKASFVRYFIKINDYNTAYTLQDELTHHGPIYQQEFFLGKVVRSLAVDVCDDSIVTPTGSQEGTGHAIDDSSSSALVALSTFLLGVLML